MKIKLIFIDAKSNACVICASSKHVITFTGAYCALMECYSIIYLMAVGEDLSVDDAKRPMLILLVHQLWGIVHSQVQSFGAYACDHP